MFVYQASGMDPLSHVIALLKPQALAWRVIEAHDAWSLRFPTTDVVVFGQVIEGACRVALADGSTFDLQIGDFLLMSAPGAWTASTPGFVATVDLKDLFEDATLLRSGSSDPVVTRFMAGAFMFAAPAADLLATLMPPLIHVHGAEVVAGRLGALLKLLGDEAMAERPGRSLVLDRLLEIVLVEALRHRPAALPHARPGLLAGLADAKIAAALQAMHRDVQRAWTVATLAQQVGMSRSAFAQRFTACVGVSPIGYLSSWRISLAKVALTSSKRPISEVAALAGYASVSAFSTGFSRATGFSPTQYSRMTA